MILFNKMEKENLSADDIQIFLKLLAPFAPHFSEELWSRFFMSKKSRILDSQGESGRLPKNYKSIHLESWPKYNSELIEEEEYDLIIQINGKVRDKIRISKGLERLEVEKLALARDAIKKYTKGKEVKKIIFIPNRLINIVIK